MKKKSLIPDPSTFLEKPEGWGDDLSVDANQNIKYFYDEEFGTDIPVSETFSIYKSKRYDRPVPVLKQMCRDRKLPVGGRKKELIDRLHKHTEEVKKERLESKLKEQVEERKVVDKHKDTALLKIENNIKRAKALREKQLKKLVALQEEFDATEAELREMKATLKTMKKYL
tara:strand:- start:923 stop:1435 length:513 start_codon:yes stop_codon:yes gene_type:complete